MLRGIKRVHSKPRISPMCMVHGHNDGDDKKQITTQDFRCNWPMKSTIAVQLANGKRANFDGSHSNSPLIVPFIGYFDFPSCPLRVQRASAAWTNESQVNKTFSRLISRFDEAFPCLSRSSGGHWRGLQALLGHGRTQRVV